ncbi:MAG: family signal peptidase [Sphingomonas bacterium]|uniref:signal peptidase I n=1 Tax=Sphingomonas bacterium TaxID=1895847 RepID=UPI00261523E8|nr:signal peptidase I [Sphingomonas bacterium]MDB5707912.1 family signal peptidase [Sphingomonas bacterium]
MAQPEDIPAVDPATTLAEPAPKPRSETRDTIFFLVKLIIAVLIFRSFVISPFNIPSQSMLPRLYIGDYLFVSKWNYGFSRWSLPFGMPLIPGRVFGRDPARGDVVVFRGPPGEDHDVIKRVIGLPGDSIQVRHGQLILNGTAIPRERVADFTVPISPNYPAGSECPAEFVDNDAKGTPICRYMQFRETLPNGKSYMVLDRGEMPDRDDTNVYSVPAGTVFVMGDNRDDSGDSRFPAPADVMPGQQSGMGYIPMDRIEGKAVVTFFSTDGSANWFLPWTWFSAARWKRIGEGF